MRNRKTQKAYNEKLKSIKDGECEFCKMHSESVNPMYMDCSRTDDSLVFENEYPHQIIEQRYVKKSLVFITKRHVSAFNDLTLYEEKDLIDYIRYYENEGCNLILCNMGNGGNKSVAHFHIQIFKLGKKANVLDQILYLLKLK